MFLPDPIGRVVEGVCVQRYRASIQRAANDNRGRISSGFGSGCMIRKFFLAPLTFYSSCVDMAKSTGVRAVIIGRGKPQCMLSFLKLLGRLTTAIATTPPFSHSVEEVMQTAKVPGNVERGEHKHPSHSTHTHIHT